MTTLAIEKTGSQLKRAISEAPPGEEILLTENDLPIARVIPVRPSNGAAERTAWILPGSARGQVFYMSEDFDEPLEEFAD